MSKTAPVSVRLRPDLNDQVAALAATLDRPKSWVIEQAIKDYMELHAWHLAALDAGIQAANAGQVVAHGEVAAWVQSWGQPDELPTPECK